MKCGRRPDSITVDAPLALLKVPKSHSGPSSPVSSSSMSTVLAVGRGRGADIEAHPARRIPCSFCANGRLDANNKINTLLKPIRMPVCMG